MATAAKRKKWRVEKRGRKRIPGAIRTPSGRVSTSKAESERRELETQKQAQETSVERRKRQYGLKEDAVAKDSLWGFSLGRLKKTQQISEQQFKAGEKFCEDASRYYGLTGIPFPSPKAQNMFSVKGHEGDISESRQEAARSAANTFMELNRILTSCGANGRQVYSTAFNVCVLDYDCAEWPFHMIKLLQKGLDVLISYYEIDKS